MYFCHCSRYESDLSARYNGCSLKITQMDEVKKCD